MHKTTGDLASTLSLVNFLRPPNISNVEESFLTERIQAAFTLQANFSYAWEDLGDVRRQIELMQASTQIDFSKTDSKVSKAISSGLRILSEQFELERAVRSLKGNLFSTPVEDGATVICVLGNDPASFAGAIRIANKLFDQFKCKVAIMPSEKLSLAALSNALKKAHLIRGSRESLLAMDRANFAKSLNAQTFWLIVNEGQCKGGVVGSTAVAETHLLWQVKKWPSEKLDPANSSQASSTTID